MGRRQFYPLRTNHHQTSREKDLDRSKQESERGQQAALTKGECVKEKENLDG